MDPRTKKLRTRCGQVRHHLKAPGELCVLLERTEDTAEISVSGLWSSINNFCLNTGSSFGSKPKTECVCMCLTLCDPMDCSLCPWNSSGKNTGMGFHSLLQGNLLGPEVEPRSPALQADSLPPDVQFTKS